MDVAHGYVPPTFAAVLSVSGKVGDAAVAVGYCAFAMAIGAGVGPLHIAWRRIVVSGIIIVWRRLRSVG